MRGLSFTVGGEMYAVDVTLVQKVARKLAITPVPSAPAEILGVANLKGRVVTVLSLKKLLGLDTQSESEHYANTIIFKSWTNSEDQMGIAVEKPGNLIDIDTDTIRTRPLTVGTEGSFCIAGVAEVGDGFYRIIDIETIRRKYIPGGDKNPGNSSYGGTESD